MKKIWGAVSSNKRTVNISSREGLRVGQLVQVYAPTNEAIKHYSTGKVVGYKETVLGRGSVEKLDDSFIVNITQGRNEKAFDSIDAMQNNVIIKALE